MYGFEAMTFNIHGGYLEAIVRGHRSGLLTTSDYNNLCQCETLDDIKMHLSATEYGPYLQNEPSPLHTTTIVEKCTLKLVDEYKHMLCQATEPLSTFLEYITYGHMIDNVVLIVTGTLHERDVQELLEKCHPLGMFDSIATLAVAQNMRELYRLVLVDTPLAPYFSECITSEVLALTLVCLHYQRSTDNDTDTEHRDMKFSKKFQRVDAGDTLHLIISTILSRVVYDNHNING